MISLVVFQNVGLDLFSLGFVFSSGYLFICGLMLVAMGLDPQDTMKV